MNDIKQALELAIGQKFEQAAQEYEVSLTKSDISIDAYINLACLYWESVSPGTTASDTFFEQSSKRMYQVLDEAEEKFGKIPEIEFWRLCFNFITLGDPAFPVKALELAKNPKSSLVPYFHVYSQTRDSKYLPKARKLLEQARLQLTTKNRYIISLLEACGLE